MNPVLPWKSIKGNAKLLDVIIKKKAERDLDSLGEPFCSKIISEIEKLRVRPWAEDIKKLKTRENVNRRLILTIIQPG